MPGLKGVTLTLMQSASESSSSLSSLGPMPPCGRRAYIGPLGFTAFWGECILKENILFESAF